MDAATFRETYLKDLEACLMERARLIVWDPNYLSRWTIEKFLMILRIRFTNTAMNF